MPSFVRLAHQAVSTAINRVSERVIGERDRPVPFVARSPEELGAVSAAMRLGIDGVISSDGLDSRIDILSTLEEDARRTETNISNIEFDAQYGHIPTENGILRPTQDLQDEYRNLARSVLRTIDTYQTPPVIGNASLNSVYSDMNENYQRIFQLQDSEELTRIARASLAEDKQCKAPELPDHLLTVEEGQFHRGLTAEEKFKVYAKNIYTLCKEMEGSAGDLMRLGDAATRNSVRGSEHSPEEVVAMYAAEHSDALLSMTNDRKEQATSLWKDYKASSNNPVMSYADYKNLSSIHCLGCTIDGLSAEGFMDEMCKKYINPVVNRQEESKENNI